MLSIILHWFDLLSFRSFLVIDSLSFYFLSTYFRNKHCWKKDEFVRRDVGRLARKEIVLRSSLSVTGEKRDEIVQHRKPR